jgi:CRP-like cAMP-binding protein
MEENAPEWEDPEWANLFRQEAQTHFPLEVVLARVPVFSALSPTELRTLARLVHPRRFSPGETIIRRGVEQSGFYLVRSGSVQIVRHNAGGGAQVAGTLGPGALLGEFALVDGSPRTSAVVAAERSELIGFFKPDLMNIMVTNPGLGCKILLNLAAQMNQTLTKDYHTLVRLGYDFLQDGEGPAAR